jgi:hypothetical protein
MKKLSLLFALLLVLPLFNSCEEETKNLLIGKWGWVSGTYAEYEDDVLVESGTISEPFFVSVEIKKGGTGTLDTGDGTEDFTWKKSGDTLTINEGTVDEMIEKIITNTKTSLVVEVTMTEEEGGVVYKYVQTITMVKIP